MQDAQLVRERTQSAEGIGPLPEHFTALPAHRVDDEVGVDVLGVGMGGNEHLTVRPGLRRKLLCQLVGLFAGDLLLRGEGLDIVIEPCWALLSVRLPGGDEFPVGKLGRAVLSADQPPVLRPPCFFLLGHIPGDAAHRPGGLFLIFDKGYRCHQRASRPVSSRSCW